MAINGADVLAYALFIDDERFPPDDDINWVIARTVEEAKTIIEDRGFPKHISFDHDLGNLQPTGFDLAKWIVNHDLDNHVIDDSFTFYVHSQNPVGAENIRELLARYLKARKEEQNEE